LGGVLVSVAGNHLDMGVGQSWYQNGIGYKRGTPNLHKSAVFWAFNWTAPSGGMQIHDTDGERAEFTVKSRQTDLKEGNLASYFAKIGEQPTNQWEFQDPKLEVLYHIRPYFLGILNQHTQREISYPRRRGLESTNPGISTQMIGFLTYTRLGLQ